MTSGRLITAAVFSALSTLCVLLRLGIRCLLVRSTGRDDYAIVLSLAFALAAFSMLAFEVHYGIAKPTDALDPQYLRTQLLFLWLSIPLYNLSITFTKASILLLYIRIFPFPRFILVSRIALVVVGIYGLWCVLSSILNCIPVSAFWDSSVKGNCIPRTFLWFFNAAMNIVTDLAILIVPIPVLSKLQLPRKKKVGLILIFAAGSFACITSIVRLKIVAVATKANYPPKPMANLATWSFVEMNMGIICSCLPSLYPLFTRVLPSLLYQICRRGRCDRMAQQMISDRRSPTSITRGHVQSKSHGGIEVRQEVGVEIPGRTFARGNVTLSDLGLPSHS